MWLKMLTGISGSEFCLSPGDTRDFPETEGLRLVAAGYAEEIDMPDAAVNPKPETAIQRRKRETR
jgi:hypothetical protein